MLLVLAGFYIVTGLFSLPCPVAALMRVPCPTCGVTSAMVALVQLDIAAYLRLQPMALPLILAVWLMCNVDVLKHPRAITVYAIAVAALNVLLWLFRVL